MCLVLAVAGIVFAVGVFIWASFIAPMDPRTTAEIALIGLVAAEILAVLTGVGSLRAMRSRLGVSLAVFALAGAGLAYVGLLSGESEAQSMMRPATIQTA